MLVAIVQGNKEHEALLRSAFDRLTVLDSGRILGWLERIVHIQARQAGTGTVQPGS